MDRQFDLLMNKKCKIKNISFSLCDLIFLICLTILGFMIRFSMRRIVSGDFDGSFTNWINFISENGGIKALANPAFDYDYNVTYMYILSLVSYIKSPFSSMYFLKLFSVIFEYASAIIIFFIILELTGRKQKAILGYAITLIYPTLALNSSAFSQCDSMFSTFILLSFYYILKNKSFKCLLFMGIAFSFKIQAIFFLPFLIIMWLKNRLKLRHFLLLPVPLLVSILPVWLMGGNLVYLLNRYPESAADYSTLTVSFPNIYTFFENNEHSNQLVSAAIIFTITLFAILAYYIYKQKTELDAGSIVTLALLTVAVTVMFMPKMHERYSYLVDVMAILYGITRFRRIFVMMGYCLVSLIAYIPYLFKSEGFPFMWAALFMLILISVTGYDLYQQLHPEKTTMIKG